MRDREGRERLHQIPRAPEGQRQHDDEQQMVEAVEKPIEARFQEDPGRLMQLRIEMH